MALTIGKILRGSEQATRATRFHDGNSQFVGWWEMRHLPHALATWAARRVRGTLPRYPWWPYPSIHRIEQILRPDFVVLEFGVGSSTLWMARRVAQVYGIENAREWMARVQAMAAGHGLANIKIILRDSSTYPNGGAHSAAFNDEFSKVDDLPERTFDFVVVDGAARWRCAERALPLVKPGGYLYLDNTDLDSDSNHYVEPGSDRLAQRVLQDAERRGEGTIERLRGLVPSLLFANEGWLFHKAR